MKNTPARIQFKDHLGHANHFLVTSLVALHTLEASKVETAPPELRTSWNPQNKIASIDRSRIFVLQSFLGWAVDSIDMYISLLDRKPKCLQNDTLSQELQDQKVSRSVSKKIRILAKYFPITPDILALIDILITWRNNIFHEANDNYVNKQTRASLEEHSLAISQEYRGLDVSNLVNKAEGGAALTFKETASLINAAHNFVKEFDSFVLEAMDKGKFCAEIVQIAIGDKKQKTGFRQKYFSLQNDRRKHFVQTYLQNLYGITGLKSDELKLACNLKNKSNEVNS